MLSWQRALVEEWQKRQASQKTMSPFPLAEQNLDADEILAMAEVILSGQLTMAQTVREFETEFAKYIGVPHTVMVNSGSSANLLALAVATNPARSNHLKPGDEVLVPAVCWSTSVWPIIQMGLKPVFVDVDKKTLNINIEHLKKQMTSRTRALLVVHVLGNCGDIDAVMKIARDNHWIVIEDTCESLGSTWSNRKLGTLGDFGTYSFYFSHHMTTGEGGMVVCHNQADVDLLRCLRAHGWTRELSDRQALEKKYDHVDPRFLFVNLGYNLRPMEVQAALGLKQLTKLGQMNQARVENRQGLVAALKSHEKWAGQFEFPQNLEKAKPVWFGFPLILAESIKHPLTEVLRRLSECGVENRPIVSGNFARQPGLGLLGEAPDWRAFEGAEAIHQRGFFVGLPSRPLDEAQLQDLAGRLLSSIR